jgi:hypothetical protein
MMKCADDADNGGGGSRSCHRRRRCMRDVYIFDDDNYGSLGFYSNAVVYLG